MSVLVQGLLVVAVLYVFVLLHFPLYYAFWHLFRESAASVPWWQEAWRRSPRRVVLGLLVGPLVLGISFAIALAMARS